MSRNLLEGVYQEGVRPISYEVELFYDPARWRLLANTVISLIADKPVDRVDLNAYELFILSCDVNGLPAATIINADSNERKEHRKLTVLLPQTMQGEFKINLCTEALINDGLLGLYKSMYDTGDKEKGYFATSQCEERDQCRIFPAIDHPAAKTVFKVKAVVPKDIMALFCTPVKREKDIGDGKKLVEFEDTPPMSTYLLYFGFGKFEILVDKVDPRFRAITVLGKIQYADYSLAIMRKSVHDLEKRLGVKYPLLKLDIIGVPQFQYGAMENWGILAHRENLMLYYPGETSLPEQKRIWEVVAHEVAHQWFGNLVSPVDWQYLWLNETLATYFGYDISQRHNPKWAIWSSFLREDFKEAINRVSYLYDFPVQLPDGVKIDISTSTAPIIYGKGACIYRQATGYLGEDTLIKGLSHFLKRHQYSNVDTDDFYAAMTEATKKPIKDIMQPWLEQAGHPIIDAAQTDNKLMLNQRRFTYLPNDSKDIWNIPLTYRVWQGNGKTETKTCIFNSQSMTLDLPKDTIAYKLNVGHTGLYRVKYSDANLENLTKLASDGKLSPEDIYSLETDAYALVIGDEMSIGKYLALVERIIINQASFLPLAAAADNLFELLRLKKGAKYENKILNIGKKMAESTLQITGFEPADNEPETTTLLRSDMIRYGAYFGSGKILEFALEKFDKLFRGEKIHQNILSSVLHAVAFDGNDHQTFMLLQKMHDSVKSEGGRKEILQVMGAFHDAGVLKEVWEYAINDVPKQNCFIPITPIPLGSNPYAPQIFFELYRKDQKKIDELEEISQQRILIGVFKNWQSADTDKIVEYFTDHYKNSENMAGNVKYFCEILQVENRVRHELD